MTQVLRLGLGNVRAVSTTTIVGRLHTSSEDFGHLRESLDVFVLSSSPGTPRIKIS